MASNGGASANTASIFSGCSSATTASICGGLEVLETDPATEEGGNWESSSSGLKSKSSPSSSSCSSSIGLNWIDGNGSMSKTELGVTSNAPLNTTISVDELTKCIPPTFAVVDNGRGDFVEVVELLVLLEMSLLLLLGA